MIRRQAKKRKSNENGKGYADNVLLPAERGGFCRSSSHPPSGDIRDGEFSDIRGQAGGVRPPLRPPHSSPPLPELGSPMGFCRGSPRSCADHLSAGRLSQRNAGAYPTLLNSEKTTSPIPEGQNAPQAAGKACLNEGRRPAPGTCDVQACPTPPARPLLCSKGSAFTGVVSGIRPRPVEKAT